VKVGGTAPAGRRSGNTAGGAVVGDGGGGGGGGQGGSTVQGRTGPQRLRALRWPALVVLAVLAGALLAGLAQTRVVRGELDPDAVDPAGSHALAVLLGNHGMPVQRVTTAEDAVAGTADTAVLVAFPERLPAGQLRQIAGTAPRLVLIGPDAIALREVTDAVLPTGAAEVARRDPDCEDPAAAAAGDADLGGRTYAARPGTAASTCYGGALVVARTDGGNPLVVLGTGTPLRNDSLASRGNAALALNLLGVDTGISRLRWLLPPAGAAPRGEVRLVDLVPGWVPPAALQLLAGGLLVALWRGRRLGPPVPEPLPVVVRAAETVEGRARLYRRARARDRAADALRAGALARIVPRLQAGPAPPPAAVVGTVADRTGWPGPRVGDLLYGGPPADDAALMRLADDLDALAAAVLGR
jgi:hypothetical protein